MLHASDACLSFLMLRSTSLLLYQTHAEHALTMCYMHFYYIYTLAKYHVTLEDILDTQEHWLNLRQYFGYTKAFL